MSTQKADADAKKTPPDAASAKTADGIIECGLDYDIRLTFDAGVEINKLLTGDNVFLVTDRNVQKLYSHALQISSNPERTFSVKPGERSKTLDTAGNICRAMMRARCDRKTTVVALGGGVVGDLAGFAAAIFMRGVNYIQIPTTLLAMADSSVGGKTAVDLDRFKNMAGAFKQPAAVFIDLAFLKTLPFPHITSGLGEIAKTALLDADLFDFINKNIMGLVALNRETVAEAVERSLKIKAGIVAQDERESGLRRRLNAGHTFGHALETLFSYKAGHGEYVLNGIYYELALARMLGLSDEDYSKSVFRLLDKLLDKRLALKKKDFGRFLDVCEADKKNRDGKIAFVLPERKGETRELLLSRTDLAGKLEEVFSYVD